MFGQSRYRAALSGARDSVWPYAGRMLDDEKMRQRVFAAAAAGFAAWQRARQLPRLRATAVLLASDPVLRHELERMVTQLQKAQERVERRRSHRLRNAFVGLAGVGAVVVAWRTPAVRSGFRGLVRRGTDAAGGFTTGPVGG